MLPIATISLACLICLGGAPEMPVDSQETAAPTRFSAEHGGFQFFCDLPGALLSSRAWPDIDDPRKFSFELVAEAGKTQVFLHVFTLEGRSGDWWLEEVMGFLFQPEVTVRSDTTALGYEAYYLEFPGGHGAYPNTQVLIVAGNRGFRFTCPRCREFDAVRALQETCDSLALVELGGPES